MMMMRGDLVRRGKKRLFNLKSDNLIMTSSSVTSFIIHDLQHPYHNFQHPHGKVAPTFFPPPLLHASLLLPFPFLSVSISWLEVSWNCEWTSRGRPRRRRRRRGGGMGAAAVLGGSPDIIIASLAFPTWHHKMQFATEVVFFRRRNKTRRDKK